MGSYPSKTAVLLFSYCSAQWFRKKHFFFEYVWFVAFVQLFWSWITFSMRSWKCHPMERAENHMLLQRQSLFPLQSLACTLFLLPPHRMSQIVTDLNSDYPLIFFLCSSDPGAIQTLWEINFDFVPFYSDLGFPAVAHCSVTFFSQSCFLDSERESDTLRTILLCICVISKNCVLPSWPPLFFILNLSSSRFFHSVSLTVKKTETLSESGVLPLIWFHPEYDLWVG